VNVGRFVLCACPVLAFSVVAFSQGLPTQKVLTVDVAQEIAQEAMASYRLQGFEITVLVDDSSNELKVFYVMTVRRWELPNSRD
jgi:hypothetical protein